MPVTMECGVNLKCRPSIVKFVIPLGTNINRDGAALYEAASVLFIAQVSQFSHDIKTMYISEWKSACQRYFLSKECCCWDVLFLCLHVAADRGRASVRAPLPG